MELRNIQSFLKIAELSSFSKTAELLGYSQSNITMQIKQLESELGVRLFDRIGKTVSLTEDGRVFQRYALSAVNSLESGTHALSKAQEPSGELRIGLMESLSITYLPELLTSYHQKYPKVNPIIRIGTAEELESMLNHNEIDLIWVYHTLEDHPDWASVCTYRDYIRILAATNSNYRGKTIQLRDLQNESFILTEHNCSYRSCFTVLMQQKEIPFHLFLEIGNTEIIKRFVSTGAALAVLPEFCVKKEIESGTILCLSVEDFQMPMFGQVFYHKRKWVTPAMQTFIDAVKELISQTYELLPVEL